MTYKEAQLQRAYAQYIQSKQADAVRYGILKRAASYIKRSRNLRRTKQAALGMTEADMIILSNAARGILREKTASQGSYQLVENTIYQLNTIKQAAVDILRARDNLLYEGTSAITKQAAGGWFDALQSEENRPYVLGGVGALAGAGIGALLGKKRKRNALMGALIGAGLGGGLGMIPGRRSGPAAAPAATVPTVKKDKPTSKPKTDRVESSTTAPKPASEKHIPSEIPTLERILVNPVAGLVSPAEPGDELVDVQGDLVIYRSKREPDRLYARHIPKGTRVPTEEQEQAYADMIFNTIPEDMAVGRWPDETMMESGQEPGRYYMRRRPANTEEQSSGVGFFPSELANPEEPSSGSTRKPKKDTQRLPKYKQPETQYPDISSALLGQDLSQDRLYNGLKNLPDPPFTGVVNPRNGDQAVGTTPDGAFIYQSAEDPSRMYVARER